MRVFAYWFAKAFPAFDATTQAALLALLLDHEAPRSFGAFLLVLLIVPFSQSLLHRSGVYDSHRIEGCRHAIRTILRAQLGAFCAFCFAIAVTRITNDTRPVAVFFLLSTSILIAERVLIYIILHGARRRGYDSRNVCVVGSPERASELSEQFSRSPQWGLRVACICDAGPERRFVDFYSGELIGTELEAVLKARVIDEILIAVPPESFPLVDSLMRLCGRYGLNARVLFDALGERSPSRVENFHGAATLSLGYPQRNERSLALKRAFDIVISMLVLLLAAPVLISVAIAVKLSSPGPVLFIQTRVGLNGRRFPIYKFRTMIDGADSMVRHAHRSITNGPIFKDVNDYRVTEVGRVLRRFSLDELPQLFNVLKGDMSLVGPRPLPVNEADQITGDSRRRFSMPPGITCFWQVSGRSNVGFERWMQYDLQYVDSWSLWSDAMVLFRTIPVVLTGKGAF